MKKFFITCMAAVFAAISQAAVTVPADATVETWVASFVMHYNSGSGDQTEKVSESMEVAFAGSDVYFNLPNPFAGNTWVKGTIDGTKAVFAKGQYLGDYEGAVYMVGQDEQGICDVVFGYDVQNGLFTQGELNIVLSGSDTSVDAWAYYTGMTVSKYGSAEQSETWTLTGRNVNPNNESQYEDLKEPVTVSIADGHIAIQGLSAYAPEGWLQGTIDGNTATFAKMQSAGNAGATSLYMIGYAGDGAVDIVFDYDAEAGILTSRGYILCIDAEGVTYQMLTDVVITRSGDVPVVDPDPVVAPSNLTTREYVFKGSSIQYAADGTLAGMENVQFNVRVGFQGNDVYVQGLFRSMPLAWVKGLRNADGDFVFENGQFYGSNPQVPSMKFFFGGEIFGELSDVEMSYNSSTRVLSCGSYYLVTNSQKNVLAPYEVFAGVTLSPVPNVAATPATPEVVRFENYNEEYNYGFACFNLPTTDVSGNPIDRGKMSYKVYYEQGGEQHVYTFGIDKYEYIDKDTQTIPYFFSDGWDFYMGGSQVVFYEEIKQWEKIGVQTVYTGGGETRASDVGWYVIEATGIGQTAVKEVVSETYTDLHGRRATAASSGLLIRTQRMADGSVVTKKVMRYNGK